MNKISSKLNELASENKDEAWCPRSFDHLLEEIIDINEVGNADNSLILYRGQTNINWPIDSTFVRNSIPKLFGIKNYIELPSSIRRRSTLP